VTTNRRIHLDVLGGVAGDMFVAAILDLYPELAEECFLIARKLMPDENLELSHTPCHDGISVGSRFNVNLQNNDNTAFQAEGAHTHTHWRDIRQAITDSDIPVGTRQHALAIFEELAQAEAHCHGIDVDKVGFHEVGAWDSIADILAAAYLIDALGTVVWTMSTLPTGSGTVNTSHGLLPVPVPAVVRLLNGYIFIDDGIKGERITPTGAAILKYLNPSQTVVAGESRLVNCGVGFGSKSLSGVSNILRVLVYDEVEPANTIFDSDQVIKLQFDIDDQTAEDLAVGLERIRVTQGVIDVVHATAIGKKGRFTMMVQVLLQPEAKDRVIELCFNETTTLGLRWTTENRTILRREHIDTESGHDMKLAQRPTRLTAKMEMDNLVSLEGGHNERQRIRELKEHAALDKVEKIR
jgi:pyridinium-3,5-bisthiocarboxylic acid mononucleotide nickel chelatase